MNPENPTLDPAPDALQCRDGGQPTELGSIMFMPGGIHEVTPSQGGRTVRVQVRVDRAGAAAIERQRQAILAGGRRPYFDFNHDDGPASFWPDRFQWQDTPEPGIYASGKWSDAGADSARGKRYRQFSPVFFVNDPAAKPATLVCNESARPNMGGLVNNPAFSKILPLFAACAAEAPEAFTLSPIGASNQVTANAVAAALFNLPTATPPAPSTMTKLKASGVEVLSTSVVDLCNAYSAIQGKQRAASTHKEKYELAREAGELYCKELLGNKDMLGMPLSASNSPGTLSGTIVAQKVLELLKISFPVLSAITADFSAEPTQYNQVLRTRIISIPTVQAYNASTGWTQSDQSATDVDLTISAHKGVPITFDSNTLSGTMRRLFAEFAPAAAYALAKDLVDALYANITAANFTATPIVCALADFSRPTVIDMATTQTVAGVPSGSDNRSLLLYPTYYGAVAKDNAIVTLSAFQNPEIIEKGTLPDVHGYKVIEAANLPAGSDHIVGFGFSKSALAVATRLPIDYTTVMPGASFGNVNVVTDPNTGLSLVQTEYVDHQKASATQRVAWMYGVAKGQVAAGQILASQ